jgi:hypothetical protein
MHDTARRLHGGRRRQGTTLDRFRLNELVSNLPLAGGAAGSTGRSSD